MQASGKNCLLRWLNRLGEEQLQRKLEKHLRPLNCDRLTLKVNPKIWDRRTDKQIRGKKLKLSYLQTNVTKIGNIIAKTTDKLLKAEGFWLANPKLLAISNEHSYQLSFTST